VLAYAVWQAVFWLPNFKIGASQVMFASLFVFIVVGLQIGLIALSYYKQWAELFAISFYQVSPIMVFLGVLNKAGLFSGITSDLVWVGLGFCVIKYFMFTRALVNEEPNFFSRSALIGEAGIIGLSGWYIVYYFY
jgi:hypothetical protein